MDLFAADLVIAAVAFLVLEFLVFRHKYWIFSPFSIFVVTFLILYGFPFFAEIHVSRWPRMGELREAEIENGINALRWFFYTWFVVALALCFRARRLTMVHEGPRLAFNEKYIWIFVLGFAALYLLFLGAGVDFSPFKMVDRLIHPRDYTYIKEGFGPLTTVKTGLNQVLLYVVLVAMMLRPRRRGYRIAVVLLLTMTILGGTKASMMFPMFFYFLVRQRYSLQQSSRFGGKIALGVAAIVAAVALLFGAFSFYRQSQQETTITDTASTMQSYIQEAYMTTRVINDYDASVQYGVTALLDTIVAPIPRVLWPGKPYVGFYRRYWQPRYHPDTPTYHTTTCGSLAEAHMIFGRFGPPVYGALFAVMCYLIFALLNRARDPFWFFIALYLNMVLFYFTRAGLTGTLPSLILTVVVVAWFTIHLCIQVLRPSPRYE